MSFVVLWFKDHKFLLTTVNLLLLIQMIRILKNTKGCGEVVLTQFSLTNLLYALLNTVESLESY